MNKIDLELSVKNSQYHRYKIKMKMFGQYPIRDFKTPNFIARILYSMILVLACVKTTSENMTCYIFRKRKNLQSCCVKTDKETNVKREIDNVLSTETVGLMVMMVMARMIMLMMMMMKTKRQM